MEKIVRHNLVTMEFYVRGGQVVAVTGPNQPTTTVRLNPGDYELPEPRGYSTTQRSMVWSMALYADCYYTSWWLLGMGNVYRRRIYPHPWYRAWQPVLDILTAARRRLVGLPFGEHTSGTRALVDQAIELILIDIARKAYDSYITWRHNLELTEKGELLETVSVGTAANMTDAEMIAQVLGPLAADILSRLPEQSSNPDHA